MKEHVKKLLAKSGFVITETEDGWTSTGTSSQFEMLLINSFYEYEALLKQQAVQFYNKEIEQYRPQLEKLGFKL